MKVWELMAKLSEAKASDDVVVCADGVDNALEINMVNLEDGMVELNASQNNA